MRDKLQAILSDPGSTPEERAIAQEQLDGSDAPASEEVDGLSLDAQTMLAALGLKPLALFAVNVRKLDEYCKKQGITGTRYDALYEEWQDYHLPSDEWLRLLHLADSGTDIHWGWLAHWRSVLGAPKKRLVKLFAQHAIKMLAEYENVPAHVREAAVKFLADHEEGPLPEINIPGKELWPQMPHKDLHRRMVRMRELAGQR